MYPNKTVNNLFLVDCMDILKMLFVSYTMIFHISCNANYYINELYISVNNIFYSFHMWIYVECYRHIFEIFLIRLNVTTSNEEVIDIGLDVSLSLFQQQTTFVPTAMLT